MFGRLVKMTCEHEHRAKSLFELEIELVLELE